VVWDADAIGKSVSVLSADANATPKAQRLVSQVCARSTDGDLRLTCLRALQPVNAPALAGADAARTQPLAVPGPIVAPGSLATYTPTLGPAFSLIFGQ
jgi:hypothetical protein